MDDLSSLISRLVFVVASACATLAITERAMHALGYTILRGSITAGRLLEVSAILVIFVIAVLLRQIRDQLRARSG